MATPSPSALSLRQKLIPMNNVDVSLHHAETLIAKIEEKQQELEPLAQALGESQRAKFRQEMNAVANETISLLNKLGQNGAAYCGMKQETDYALTRLETVRDSYFPINKSDERFDITARNIENISCKAHIFLFSEFAPPFGEYTYFVQDPDAVTAVKRVHQAGGDALHKCERLSGSERQECRQAINAMIDEGEQTVCTKSSEGYTPAEMDPWVGRVIHRIKNRSTQVSLSQSTAKEGSESFAMASLSIGNRQSLQEVPKLEIPSLPPLQVKIPLVRSDGTPLTTTTPLVGTVRQPLKA